MKEKTVEQALTDIDKVYAIDIDAKLSWDILEKVYFAKEIHGGGGQEEETLILFSTVDRRSWSR